MSVSAAARDHEERAAGREVVLRDDGRDDAPEPPASPRSTRAETKGTTRYGAAVRIGLRRPSARKKQNAKRATPEPAPAKETTHLFTLTADVRSSKSTRRLPFPTASVVVKLSLPAELLDAVSLGGKPRAATTTLELAPIRPRRWPRPLVILQNGLGHVDFGAGVMGPGHRARRGPARRRGGVAQGRVRGGRAARNRHRLAAPLLREPTLDGAAPVMSDADPETPAAPSSALLLDARP